MRPHVRAGKLVPPKNLTEGEKRLARLGAEVDRVRAQLFDPARARAMRARVGDAGYEAWCKTARDVRDAFKLEERLLARWVEGQRAIALPLLREARDLLAEFDDFDPRERLLLARIDRYLGVKYNR